MVFATRGTQIQNFAIKGTLVSSAVICCHLTAGTLVVQCTRARGLLLPHMPQGGAEGVAGLDQGLRAPLHCTFFSHCLTNLRSSLSPLHSALCTNPAYLCTQAIVTGGQPNESPALQCYLR